MQEIKVSNLNIAAMIQVTKHMNSDFQTFLCGATLFESQTNGVFVK